MRYVDNSGHFVGQGYGVSAHNDPRPLTMVQIDGIPEFVLRASARDILPRGTARGLARYMILGILGGWMVAIIEVRKNRTEVDLVSVYNVTEAYYAELLGQKQKSLRGTF